MNEEQLALLEEQQASNAGLSEKFTAMQARIDALETEKKNAQEVETPPSDQQSADIKESKILDLQAEIEAMKHNQESQTQNVVELAMKKVELNQKLSRVLSGKKDILSDALNGKSIEDQLNYLDKYAGTYLVPSMGYSGGGSDGMSNSSKSSEIDKMMGTDIIKESGLTKEQVQEFMSDDDVLKFEKKLMRDFKEVKNISTLKSFFKGQ